MSERFAFLALTIQEALIFGAQLTQPSRCIKLGTRGALLNVPWLHEISPDNIGIEECAFRETHGCQCRKWNTCDYDLISLDHGGAVRRRYQKLDLSEVSIDRGERWAGGINQSDMSLVHLLERCGYLFYVDKLSDEEGALRTVPSKV